MSDICKFEQWNQFTMVKLCKYINNNGVLFNSSAAGDGIFLLWGPMSYLLMPWFLKLPEYQQACYWLCRIDNMWYCFRVNFIYLGQAKSKTWFKMWIYLLSGSLRCQDISSPDIEPIMNQWNQFVYTTSFPLLYHIIINISLSYLPSSTVPDNIVVRGQQEVFLIARFMGPTWIQSGANRTQMGPMLAQWTLLSGMVVL